MIPVPAKLDPVSLADWLEFSAICSQDHQVSIDFLIAASIAGSIFTEPEIERILPAITDEFDSRRRYATYPFSLKGSSLEHRKNHGFENSTYAFCLALSVLPRRTPKMSKCFPERIFEEIATLAAKRYLAGDAVRFASPRKSAVPAKFEKAIDYLIQKMREGTSLKGDHITGYEKDAKVDIVAWKLLDDRPGKIMILGSCATGDHWRDKLGEVNPDSFCINYFSDPPVPTPIKAFFTSSIIPRDRWTLYTRDAGILFDRFRIADLVPHIPAMKTHGDGEVWLKMALDTHA